MELTSLNSVFIFLMEIMITISYCYVKPKIENAAKCIMYLSEQQYVCMTYFTQEDVENIYDI